MSYVYGDSALPGLAVELESDFVTSHTGLRIGSSINAEAMDKAEVMTLLASHQNERGIQNWNELYPDEKGMSSFGIGLTVLRKLAKQIGRDHDLALQLWSSDNYDARIVGLLIDDPKLITREQAEEQVENLQGGHLAHVFSSCDASLAKTSFVVELASDWMQSEDSIRRCCGYGLLYEVSKWKKKSTPDDAFFLQWIDHIGRTQSDESNTIKLAMGGALMGIGKRNALLNAAALEVAKAMGPIPVESGKTQCEPFDVVKHLTSDYLRQKFAV